MVEIQSHPCEIRIFEDRSLIAVHPVLEGRNQRRIDPSHRRIVPAAPPDLPMPAPQGVLPEVARRPLAFYDAVARRLASRQGLQK